MKLGQFVHSKKQKVVKSEVDFRAEAKEDEDV
jgi:hypothetical protein